MLELKKDNVTYNPMKKTFTVNFEMTMEFYKGIKTAKMVEDLGLAILTAAERDLNKEMVDTPETPQVKL